MRTLLPAAMLVGLLSSSAHAGRSAELIFNDPSAYIGVWETTPSTAVLTVTADAGTPAVEARFHVRISHESLGLLASGESGTVELDAGPSVRSFTTSDIITWEELDYEEELLESVYRSGRLPEGEYTVEVEVRDLTETLLARTEASFTIAYPEPPELIAPAEAAPLITSNPTFQWTPVVLPAGHTVSYLFKVVELLEGQAPETAIDRNPSHHEARTSGTVLTYPVDALPLERGRTYVWQVQALDEEGRPAASNEGKSEIRTFSLEELVPRSGEAMFDPERVNLEITVDEEVILVSDVGQRVELEVNFLDTRPPGPGGATVIRRYNLRQFCRDVESGEVRWSELGRSWGRWDPVEPEIVLHPGGSGTFTGSIVFDEELISAVLGEHDSAYLDIYYEFEVSYHTTDRWGEPVVREGHIVHAPYIRIEVIRGEEERRAEEVSVFGVRVSSPGPFVFHPGVLSRTVEFEFDATGFSHDLAIDRVRVWSVQFVFRASSFGVDKGATH